MGSTIGPVIRRFFPAQSVNKTGGVMMLLIIHGFMVIVFVLLSILFFCGKGAFLIAGYNTASKAERETIDEKKLCRCMGKLMLALAVCWLVIASSEVFGRMWLLWLGLGAFILVLIGGVIYMNTGDHIKR